MEIKESIKTRRSYYGISKESTISDEAIIELVKTAVDYVPSAFDCKSQTVLVLFGDKHDRLWDIAMEALRQTVPANHFSNTEQKIKSFKAGYGTIIYCNNDAITKAFRENFPLYENRFPSWAEQANGMLQYTIWNLLESEGLGASLQHYDPLIDDEARKAFDIPQDWRIIAQMPFGIPVSQPNEKQFEPIENRMKILK